MIIMKIVLCGSLAFGKEFDEIREKLEKAGHLVFTSDTAEDAKKKGIADIKKWLDQMRKFETDKFVKYTAEKIKGRIERIKSSDAILVVNQDKCGVKNYVGSSTLMEIGSEEIQAMKPIVLNGKLEWIRTPTM
jgi:hypothetical protein